MTAYIPPVDDAGQNRISNATEPPTNPPRPGATPGDAEGRTARGRDLSGRVPRELLPGPTRTRPQHGARDHPLG